MKMTTLTIELPDELAKFLKERVAGGEYQSESEYLQQILLERELETQSLEDWDTLYPTLASRASSEDYLEGDEAYWTQLEKRLAQRRKELANSSKK